MYFLTIREELGPRTGISGVKSGISGGKSGISGVKSGILRGQIRDFEGSEPRFWGHECPTMPRILMANHLGRARKFTN